MGGASSTLLTHHTRISVDMCVRLVLPLYYTTDQVEEEDLNRARASWHFITEDTSPAFQQAKLDPNFHEISALSWFFTTFYTRLFDVHPACRSLFKNNLQTQGKALAKIISMLLQGHNDPAKLNEVLTDLAIRHVSVYGVKAHEYGILGEVLLYSLSKCVGSSFDDATVNSWVRIYSMLIAIIVPFHVKSELAHSKRELGLEDDQEHSRSHLSFSHSASAPSVSPP